MLCAAPVLALVAAGSLAADEKPDAGVAAAVVKVDAADHAVTVRMKDADGKDIVKTFMLTDATRVMDLSGKTIGLDAVEAGNSVLVVVKDGRLVELRRGAGPEGRGPFDAARFIDEYDRNKDGFIQREELPPRLRHAFDQIDTNKDGKLSREELEAGAAFLQPKRRPSDIVNVLIGTSESDDDSAPELQAMYDVLRKVDKNGDGKIDADELKEYREKMIEERVDNLIKELDTNKDGKISRDEAWGRVKRDFDKIDLNKDGFLDREELLKAARERAASPPPDKDAAPPKVPQNR
jgi:Ca2+-binding EF-hand superfamily protein